MGHTAGKPNEPELQRELILRALEGFTLLRTPGSVLTLPFRWSDDDAWKDGVMRPGNDRSGESGGSGDNRGERESEPQYQCEADQHAAEEAFERDGCPTCVFLPGETAA